MHSTSRSLKIISLNIGNPSLERAVKQAKWIVERDEDIFILTETKDSKGCQYLADYFNNYNYSLLSLTPKKSYYVYFPRSLTKDLGVMIISKISIHKCYSMFEKDSRFYSRFAGCEINLDNIIVKIIGLYVPSRDRSIEKIRRKEIFCSSISKHIATFDKNKLHIVCGDFNILERSHMPKYSNFFDWEYSFYDDFHKYSLIDTFKYCNPNSYDYSWFGRTNNGYRYDYFFISESHTNVINGCYFLHETRTSRLTDHSAIVLNLVF